MRAAALAALLFFQFCLVACDAPSRDTVTDAPYPRIVTLAPNLAELVYSAGAGDRLVGVSAYSDYPPAVMDLPLIGDAFTIDQEQLALLEPDLLLAWQSGTPAHVVDELRQAGYRVEVIETRRLDDIARAVVRIGELAGVESQAELAANELTVGLEQLAAEFTDEAPIRTFYQVSSRPLYTVSGSHYASELIELCGGINIFAGLQELAPAIDVEAVIDRDPEVILAGTDAGEEAFVEWERWPAIAANRYGNRFLVPSDEMSRATTRVIVAGRAVCEALQVARVQRESQRGKNER